MVYLDDSSSGEYGETDNPPPIPARHYEYSPSSSSPPLREPDYTYRELVSPPSSITSDSEDSYYSEGDDIAEYWDPYRELDYCMYAGTIKEFNHCLLV